MSPSHACTAAHPDARAEPRRQARTLAAVCLACAAMPMTFTGPAVALGDIADSFAASPIALAWVTNAFMLAFGSSLMAAGALADRLGRRRVFRSGLALFVGSSAALAAAPSLWCFDLLRALQGLASAAIFAGGAALLAQAFDGPAHTRAFSWLGTSFGLGLVLGPVAAGQLATAFGWRAIFALVIAMAALAAGLGAGTLRESRTPQAGAFDWRGATSFTLALTALTCAVLQAAARGWANAPVALGLLTAALLFAAFVRTEHRAPQPMLDLSLLRYRRFIGVQCLAAAPAYAYVVLLVLLPARFAGIEGASPAVAGWRMAALSAPLMVLPIAAGALTRWFAPATLCGAGLLGAAGGLFWLAHATGAQALVAMALIGAGISLPWGLMDGLALSVVPRERAGMAAGIFSTTRVAGEGVALALVGTALAGLVRMQLPAGEPMAAVAQQLAGGRLQAAAALAPGLSAQALARAYEQAFSWLLLGLSSITLLTAAVVFLSLRHGCRADQARPLRGPASPP
ncbi:MFS transporter [Ideonella azotifigens]|uniref:MFS transporter n=1 Tax=Ideonella azotifigens TaxID=513160 RepID=A0ABP3V202_9BURK|nr:MFS transporter [Ideonella azotifigens]MCD2340275.1 MFS transporter [Ideonella azotifigens]